MAEASYQDAVQTLKTHVGDLWQGTESDGRDEMVNTLKRELNYSDRQANDAIDAMIESGQLRYVRAVSEQGEAGDPALLAVPPANAGLSTGTPGGLGAPVVPAGLLGGHWQIGHDDGGEAGRAGQVKVDY